MLEYQLIDLFERIKMHYPNFSAVKVKRDEWFRLLKDVDVKLANANLDRYLLSPDHKFAPHPGVLADQSDADSDEYHEQMRAAGEQATAEWREMIRNAVIPTPEQRRKVRDLFDKHV